MSNGDWTPDREAILTQRWMQGWSARQIGLELGVSRNSVIGKRIRMGLPDRITPRNPRGTKQKPLPRQKPKSALKLEVDAWPSKAPARTSESVRWLEHTQGQCEMLCKGEEGALGYVCGAPTPLGQSWCKSCRKIAYLPYRPFVRQQRRAA